MTEKKIKCRQYDSWGDCIEWVVDDSDTLVGRLDPMAKSCNPKLAKQAEKHMKEGRVKVRLY
jgi:hypothetical protein